MFGIFNLIMSVLTGILGIASLFGFMELHHVTVGIFLLTLSIYHFDNFLER